MSSPMLDQPPLVQRGEMFASQDAELVTIPDMFVSFLALEPRINPDYEQVKHKSDSWIAE